MLLYADVCLILVCDVVGGFRHAVQHIKQPSEVVTEAFLRIMCHVLATSLAFCSRGLMLEDGIVRAS